MTELHVGDRPVETEREIGAETVGRHVPPEIPREAPPEASPDQARLARRPLPPAAPRRRSPRLRLGLATPASLRAAILARVILHERLHRVQLTGMALALPATILMAV